MSTRTKAKPKGKPQNAKRKGGRTAPRICWFEIPADNPDRAKKFYGALWEADEGAK